MWLINNLSILSPDTLRYLQTRKEIPPVYQNYLNYALAGSPYNGMARGILQIPTLDQFERVISNPNLPPITIEYLIAYLLEQGIFNSIDRIRLDRIGSEWKDAIQSARISPRSTLSQISSNLLAIAIWSELDSFLKNLQSNKCLKTAIYGVKRFRISYGNRPEGNKSEIN